MGSGLTGPAFGESPAKARQETPPTPAGSQKSAVSPNPRREVVLHHQKNDLISVNFIDMDIRKAISAIAMEREINISTAAEVVGNISIHLYRVPLEEALTAITLAGGCRYKKLGDLYFVYKSQGENVEQPIEDVQMRVFKLNYVDVDKVQEILECIPGIRMVKIHKATNTIVMEDVPENIAKVETILRSWDAQPKQVVIEAKILEVELTDDMTLGVQWDKILGDGRIGTRFGRAVLPEIPGGSPLPNEGLGLIWRPHHGGRNEPPVCDGLRCPARENQGQYTVHPQDHGDSRQTGQSAGRRPAGVSGHHHFKRPGGGIH